MNIDVVASKDVNHRGDSKSPPYTGFASDVLPKVLKPVSAESSHTGVSTKNAPSGTDVCKKKSHKTGNQHWYALRTTYGREKKAYEFITGKGITAFYPTLTTFTVVNGKHKKTEQSRLPNIFFAYGTEEEIKSFVYDNLNLPFLRFYYRRISTGGKTKNIPLIVPDNQLESLRIICKAEAEDIIISADKVQKFHAGQPVRIISGQFKGVTGRVARYQGQQRVGIVIEGLLTVATAYIPSAFLEKI